MPLIIIFVLVVIPVGLTIAFGSTFSTGTGVVAKVDVVEATKDNITEELVITGTVASENISILFSPVNGTIDTCFVKVGQAVKEGELLASFDLDALEMSYKQSELSYLQSKSEYDVAISNNNKLKTNAATAQKKVNELENSIEKLEANISTYEKKLDELSTSQVTLQAQMEQLNAEIETKQALLEDAELETKLELEAELEALKAELDTLEIQLSEAVANITKYTNAIEDASQSLSEQNLSLVENKAIAESGENAMTQDQLDVLEAGNELSELASLDADELLEKGKEGVLAPYDGIISYVTILDGSQVAQGMELITIQSNTQVCVKLEVLADDFDSLHVGDSAEIQIKNYIYTGKVSEVNQIATINAMGASVIGATVQIDNPDENIFLGVDAKTTIITDEKEGVICVPSRVINTSAEGDFVYVIEEGIVVKKNIEIGISVLDKVEILSGLAVGDQVISDMSSVLSEGMQVEAKEQ